MMLLAVKILGAIGGLLVLIAGFVGATPFLKLQLKPGQDLTAGQITGVVRVLKSYLSWALVLFGVGGVMVLCAFLVFLSM